MVSVDQALHVMYIVAPQHPLAVWIYPSPSILELVKWNE